MERSFKKEVQALRLGDGEIFRGEGILAVTKALLQSGVSYVGGYQGAPVSHLLDVLVDAQDIMAELGVHLETCANEASAAAMLGASINYPLRGAVTWKSIVGTNVAADALSNLSSPGVIGGAMIIIGEDYGEGASVIQERSYAYALKSAIWLLDPRPDLPSIVRTVEKGFELSEASHAPVMLELRIRACHATGEFAASDNRKGVASGLDKLAGPPRFNYARLSHPPVTFSQEKLKVEERLPAARAFIREHKLNEFIAGELDDIGIIVMGGLDQFRAARARAHGACRRVRRLARADAGAQRGLSAGAGGNPRILRRQTRRAGGRGRQSRLHRAGVQRRIAPRRHPDPCARQGAAAAGRRIYVRRAAGGACRLSASQQAERSRRRQRGGKSARPDRAQGESRRRARAPAAAPARLLHRLPGAPGVFRHQADAARIGTDPYQHRYRLPFVCDLRAVLARQFHSRLRHVAGERRGGDAQHGEAADRDHGRWRLLA